MNYRFAASSLLAGLLCGTAALAQVDTRAGPPPEAQNPSQTANTEVADAGDIIVTAQRRASNLQKTPIAVSAFSQATLDRQQVPRRHRPRAFRSQPAVHPTG